MRRIKAKKKKSFQPDSLRRKKKVRLKKKNFKKNLACGITKSSAYAKNCSRLKPTAESSTRISNHCSSAFLFV